MQAGVSIYHGKEIDYPSAKPYDPDSLYPELTGICRKGATDRSNLVYGAVRESLRLLALDEDKFGSPSWNPLSKYVKPQSKVLIKPNLVLHETGMLINANCITTHGSVIRPIVDYVYLALQGHGEIIIADAPLQSARFEEICKSSGLLSIIEHYRRELGFNISLLDLRQVYAVKDETVGYILEQRSLAGDPSGYVEVDLKGRSAFERPDAHLDTSRFAVTDYSTRGTRCRHGPDRHEYVISRTVLDADCVIAVPKLKVHEKVGLTACLKGMVGIVGSKDCLPHYRVGPPKGGGDEYMDEGSLLSGLWSAVRRQAHQKLPLRVWTITRAGGEKLSSFILSLRRGTLIPPEGVMLKPITSGAWWGNDTAWRMVDDLNRIFLYAGSDGIIHSDRQRRFFALVDGIVAGERNGPLAPDSRHLGLIIAGDNAWAVDVICASVIGFDWTKIPMLRNSVWQDLSGERSRAEAEFAIACRSNMPDFRSLRSLQENSFMLVPPPGWAGRVELNGRAHDLTVRTHCRDRR